MIGDNVQRTVEYTIYRKARKNSINYDFTLEVDGVPLVDERVGASSIMHQNLHDAAKRHAKKNGYKNAGLTEAFGRNRQFILTPRGSWKRYKVVDHD